MTGWQILTGDCWDVLATLPTQSVHTVVTSPPYFGLRSYSDDSREIGKEPSPDEYVAALVEVFRRMRRVLRDDGTVWLNLGDSYASGDRGWRAEDAKNGARAMGTRPRDPAGVKPKDLLGIPWMVAFALRADGWYLRSDIVWAKPSPMPESVTDRPTKSHEYIFLLSKSAKYHYDADAIREEPAGEYLSSGARNSRFGKPGGVLPHERGGRSTTADDALIATGHRHGDQNFGGGTPEAGRNKRSVWTVATQPFPGQHFAVFPSKLIEPCVLAGCPERACGECGAPWERVVEREPVGGAPSGVNRHHIDDVSRGTLSEVANHDVRTLGFAPACACDAGTTPGVVLDPFAGAGTTGLVALRHNRSFIGIELNPEYAEMARQRIRDDAPLFNVSSEVDQALLGYAR